MTRIAYQPCSDPDSQKNLIASIHTPVSLEHLSKFLSDADMTVLHAKYPEGKAYVWGVTPNQNALPAWDQLSEGDISIFNIKTLFSIAGVVTHKTRNKDLATNLWGWKDKNASYTWECLYFLDQVTRISVPYGIAMDGSSSQPKMAFNLLNESNSEIVLDNMDIGSLIAGAWSTPDISTVRSEIEDDTESVDGSTETPTRKEHRYIVNHIFGTRTEAECSMCGRMFPRGYLVAAHIKKRSRCTLKEKKDIENIATPMCAFGCDTLFENGFISVNDSGNVMTHPYKIEHDAIFDYVRKIEGNSCPAFTEKTKNYFKWHRKEHGFEAI
ncbi:hypothetical protein SAMN05216203_1503 [Marinobacter daqiaonensis]|uniref:HNH endonuclease n=1 Tax=Marinobacter daqiaonensis TaxID=650891 RepID=A0A1I6HST9_9GAMM|nr:hypothetical protein [Marinobacter daqiaonensis]SFR57467.1 hypothetical protein SAMN05216203_1503 [Marinobacter daqiaonensis]